MKGKIRKFANGYIVPIGRGYSVYGNNGRRIGATQRTYKEAKVLLDKSSTKPAA